MGVDRAVSAGGESARPATRTDLREVVNAMLYVLTTGCQWRMLPTDLPPDITVQRFFYGGRDDGIGGGSTIIWSWRRGRDGSGGQPDGRRDRQPDRQNHQAEGLRGYDAGKKIKGRKRHILTDTLGLLVGPVHAADIQDRDGAPAVLERSAAHSPGCAMFRRRRLCRRQTRDRPCGARQLDAGDRQASPTAKGSSCSPRRWVVERTLAWLNRNRRLAKDFEALIATATAWLTLG